jgi:aminoglycoside phosphotransferase (APT) family kinase protein
MRNSNLVILRAIARTLANDILPAAQTPAATQQGKYVLALLGLLASREPGGLMSTAQAEGTALLDTMHAILEEAGIAAGPPLSHGFGSGPYHPDLARFQQTDADLCAAVSALLDQRDAMPSPALAQRSEEVLHQLAHVRLRLDEELLSHPERLVAADEDAPAPALPDEATLQSFIREKLPAYSSAKVTGLSAAAFSLGKQITFLDVEMEDGSRSDLVMRQEKAVKIWESGDSTAVKDEFRVLQVVKSLGLPVPNPLLLDTSGKLGPTFMLMPKVRGEQLGEVFKSFAPLSEDMIMQIAEIMAKLHGAGLDPFADFLRETGRGHVLGTTTREAMYARICEWERTCSEARQFPNPMRLWLFDWLKRNIPENTDDPVFVHGDFGIHNLLAEEGRITACLDWEWSHVGNPVEDIAYMRPHIDQYSSWDRFVQHYAAHGGPELRLSDDIIKFNACLSNVIFSALGAKMAWFVEKGDRRDMASVFGADWYGYEFERMALRAALEGSKI